MESIEIPCAIPTCYRSRFQTDHIAQLSLVVLTLNCIWLVCYTPWRPICCSTCQLRHSLVWTYRTTSLADSPSANNYNDCNIYIIRVHYVWYVRIYVHCIYIWYIIYTYDTWSLIHGLWTGNLFFVFEQLFGAGFSMLTVWFAVGPRSRSRSPMWTVRLPDHGYNDLGSCLKYPATHLINI